MTPAANWLLDRWAEENARTLQSMTDARPAVSYDMVSADTAASAFSQGALYLEVTLSVAAGSLFWIAVPPEAAEALGKRTLEAAGIDDARDEEVKNTCLEILQQAHGGLAQAISVRLKRGITSKGREIEGITATDAVYSLQIVYAGSPQITTFAIMSAALLAGLDPATDAQPATVSGSEAASSSIGTSKTFEALLQVSMPVSISFGRTEMVIKEVLKLTTGSIIELNRALTEPVDVVINGRVIARGEVVVVDGNYGVRIHHIVSRQERFKSGMQPAVTPKLELPGD